MKGVVKKILGERTKRWLLDFFYNVDLKFIIFFSKTPFLSSIYYAFFSSRFRRESYSVLKGRLAYKHSMHDVGASSALLRRNIHRLEKGLIMRPRREVFAADYIMETVVHHGTCLKSELLDEKELNWANDVLSEYFSVVDISKSEIIKKAFEINTLNIKEYNIKSESSEGRLIPYSKKDSINANVSTSELNSLFLQRRSIRWFDQNRNVEESKIMKAIDMASLAPSACNRQPFSFYYTADKDIAKEVGSIPMGTAGFSSNFVALIIVIGDLSYYPHERDRHVIYIDSSLATMQLMLALETMGLSSCPVNWPDIEKFEQKLASRLGLQAQQRPVMLLPVGYADMNGMIPFSQKKSSSVLAMKILGKNK